MSDTFNYENLLVLWKLLEKEAERPHRLMFIGPPYESDYPPDDWPGWLFPQREYIDDADPR